MVPASPLRTFPCTASDTASLCPGCTHAISWATSGSQVLTDTGPMCTSTSRYNVYNVNNVYNVYVYLQRLSHMAQENLPVYNAVSSAKLRNIATQVRDWTDLGNMQ